MTLPRRLLAELSGTFFFLFIGFGAALSMQEPINSGIGVVGVALAYGLAISAAVSALGGVSGAHFNPAVTVGMLFTERIRLGEALLYVLAQLAGACLAAWGCQCLWPPEAVAACQLGMSLPAPGNMPGTEGAWLTVNLLCAFEFIFTFLLVLAIFGCAVDPRGEVVKIGSLGIGLTVACDILIGGPITGASMNPARSFGPALVYKLTGGEAAAGAFDLHWCYWAAPIAGAVAAALFYDYCLLSDDT